MLSKISRKLHYLAQKVDEIEQPILSRLKKQGGLPSTYQKLNNPWFKSLNINVVLDIGANTGQFAKTIAALLPQAKIYSFEPLPDCFEELEKFTKERSNMEAFNLGLGDRSGVIAFEHNESSQSSSFLKIMDAHKAAFPFAQATSLVEVGMARLDDIAESLDLGSPLMIKIDVQGYEQEVLKGGKKTIGKADIIICEVSFVILYESQPLFDDVYVIFRELGFICLGMLDQIVDPTTGKILQGDAVFVKSNLNA
jgi:FkbM family methyltransferase